MKPAPFRYAQVEHLEQALELLAEYGDRAKVLAGGQSLVPMMNMRLARPDVLVDINRIEALEYLTVQDGMLVTGALTRQRALERSPEVRAACPLLAQAIRYVGHPQIRNRGTVGGSIAHADPAAELPGVLLALGGQVRVRSVRGERVVPAADLFVSYFTTSLAPDELLVAVEWPIWPGRVGSAFHEVARREGDFALVGVAAQVALTDDRVSRVGLAFVGVGGRPEPGEGAAASLLGQEPTPTLLAQAAAAAAERLTPDSDLHASAEYRRDVARVLAERALAEAVARAKEGGDA